MESNGGTLNFVDRDPARSWATKILRRTTLRIAPERVTELASLTKDEAIGQILSDNGNNIEPPEFEEENELAEWWLDQMTGPNSGLHEKMTWIWSNILTTHKDKVSNARVLGRQLSLLRRNALGNYRQMLQEFVVDAALLQYLDGDGSQASKPNENLARELMELFTVGVGNYTEDEVMSAARALAGWKVDGDTGEVTFDRERAFIAPLLFRGAQGKWDTEMIVNHLCDDVATAIYIGREVWYHLTGHWLDKENAKKVGEDWHEQDLEIRPLVERALTQGMDQKYYARRRTPIEFYCAFQSVTNYELENKYRLSGMGQMVFEPPTVEGWPKYVDWLDIGSTISKSDLIHDVKFEELANFAPGSTDHVLNQCGLFTMTPETLAAIEAVANEPDIDENQASITRWKLALTSREFQLL